MIATNGGRARSKLRNRESLFAQKKKTHYKQMRISRNVLLFVVVNDDNDNTSMKERVLLCDGRSSVARVEGKFET